MRVRSIGLSCRRHRADRSLGVRAGGFHLRHRRRFDQRRAARASSITATSLATGRVHSDVSDERGEYRLRGLAPGRYKLQAELSGFATVVVPDVELLVGQNRSVPFAMQVATLTETVTVTGESPLVDISSTQVAGNVDRRQMEELPLQGRNWMELAMQVKGITANAVDTNPGRARPRLPAQSRRPGDHPAGGRRRLRAAEVQPRGDRRVPGGHQPVRHHPGPLARHPGAGGVALGHQRAERQLLRLLPRRQA